MNTIFRTSSLAAGLLLSGVLSQCVEPAPISSRILLQAPEGGAPREVSDKRTFYDGQRFKLALRTHEAGYLYVMCQTSLGEAKLLQPSKGSAASFIEAGESMIFPSAGWFRFDKDPGTEQVFVILANEPLSELDQAGSDGGDISMDTLRRYSNQSSADASGSGAKGIDTERSPISAVKRIVLRHDARSDY